MQVGELLSDYYAPEPIPAVGELDELETFVASKKNNIWLWTAVAHFRQGILGWVLGEHSAKTFQPLWSFVVSKWKCYFYVTDSAAVATQGASGWISLSDVHSRWRPNCQQNLYDQGCSRSVSPWEKAKIAG